MLETRKLLILGLLFEEDMHGYRLNEHLSIKVPITLKKPTTYNILKIMEKDKWVESKESTSGGSMRRIFTITDLGKKEFQRLLREQLSKFTPTENPSMVSISFLDHLPKEESIYLLKNRLKEIQLFLKPLSIESDHQKTSHVGHYSIPFEFARKILDLEVELLNKLIKDLQK